MESLFNDTEEHKSTTRTYTRAHFDYVKSSPAVEMVEVRKILDGWYQEYFSVHPEEAQDLKRRFRLLDNEHHLGALNELYVHHLLIENGYSAIPHPDIPGSKKHPEFLVLKEGQPAFYIESAAVVGTPTKKRTGKFEAEICDAINQINSPDFLIAVNFVSSDTNTPPSLSKIKKAIIEKIKALDYKAELTNLERAEGSPQVDYIQNNWKVTLSFSPVPAHLREIRKSEADGNVGIIQNPVRQINLDIEIKNVIETKAQKYGKLEHPFIIALNVISDNFFYDDETMLWALFGRPAAKFFVSDKGVQVEGGRDWQGAFTRNSGPINKGVSGVLVTSGMTAWNLNTIAPQALVSS